MQKKTQRGRTVQPVERRVTSRERQVLDHLLELPVRVAPLREGLLETAMHLQGRLAPREIRRCDWYRPTCAKAPLNPSASSAKIHNRTGKCKGSRINRILVSEWDVVKYACRKINQIVPTL